MTPLRMLMLYAVADLLVQHTLSRCKVVTKIDYVGLMLGLTAVRGPYTMYRASSSER